MIVWVQFDYIQYPLLRRIKIRAKKMLFPHLFIEIRAERMIYFDFHSHCKLSQ